MDPDTLAATLIDEILNEERAKLMGPPCVDGQHVPERLETGSYSRCDTCCRTIRLEHGIWKAYCGTGCECRECRTRWSQPTDALPRFDMSAVRVNSLVTMDDNHRCGKNGPMGGGAQGHWRVTSFWREARANEWARTRHEGKSLVQCEPSEALYVSLYCVCGTLIRADDFRAHATIEGHLSSNPTAPA